MGCAKATLDVIVPGFVTDGTGRVAAIAALPASLPPHLSLRVQDWFKDAAGSRAVVSSAGQLRRRVLVVDAQREIRQACVGGFMGQLVARLPSTGSTRSIPHS